MLPYNVELQLQARLVISAGSPQWQSMVLPYRHVSHAIVFSIPTIVRSVYGDMPTARMNLVFDVPRVLPDCSMIQ